MYKLLTLAFSLLFLSAQAQVHRNLELVANVEVGESGNDIWGYVDSLGTEYAIMGSRTATRIWSLEDPANPIERAVIFGESSTWRDIKSYKDHLYVTTDVGTDGLLIIDMSKAPDTITHKFWKPDFDLGDGPERLQKCHNLYIDTEQGFCYLAGCNVGVGGVIILDLNEDLDTPVFRSAANLAYSHDVYVQNDKMYASEIYLGFFNVYDVSDKDNPVLLNGAPTTTDFTHNAWLSDDEQFLFTTDERPNAYVDAFDVSDLDNIKLLDSYRPIETENSGVIPHNTHYHNGFVITSWYTDGFVVVDGNKPDNLVEVANYDTFTGAGAGFQGCWGAYPYLPSGLMLASDINSGLYILEPVFEDENGMRQRGYIRAAYLEGMVTDATTGNPIPGAEVVLLADNLPNRNASNVMGEYKTGLQDAGTFDVVFSHPNYDSDTLSATLVNGEVTILNAQLSGAVNSGTVIDAVTGDRIPNAEVVIDLKSSGQKFVLTTDNNGEFSFSTNRNATFDILAGSWGYQHQSWPDAHLLDEVQIALDRGYRDDFFADLGWIATGDAESGNWERGVPTTFTFDGQVTQTSNDLPDDFGNEYYVTALGGSSAGSDDIDDGSVFLTSPAIPAVGYDSMYVSYSLWLVNTGGQGEAPNDFVRVALTNGTDELELTQLSESASEWKSFQVAAVDGDALNQDENTIPFTDDMRIVVTAVDLSPGHLVEAGIDGFAADLVLGPLSSTEVLNGEFTIFPNPATDHLTLEVSDQTLQDAKYGIYTIEGRVIQTGTVDGQSVQIDLAEQMPAGVYLIKVYNEEKAINSKFTKM